MRVSRHHSRRGCYWARVFKTGGFMLSTSTRHPKQINAYLSQ